MSVLCVLPARLGSERIPEKPLQMLAGRSLVEWSWRAARRVASFDEVWVATDSETVAARVRAFGGTALLTSPDHRSGTDRVAEAARVPSAQGFDIVVNFQADEPFVDAEGVARAVEAVGRGGVPIATLAGPIRSEAEWRSEGVVKVARAADGRALYFSRAAIPHVRGGVPTFREAKRSPYLRHVGVYVMSRPALERWVNVGPSRLEEIERLEQLRALEGGLEIHVVVASATEPGVDEAADLERADRILRERTAGRDVNV